MAKGVLGFQYEADASNTGLTSLSGLPLYLDLIHAIGLAAAVRQRVRVAGAPGLPGPPVVLAVGLLQRGPRPPAWDAQDGGRDPRATRRPPAVRWDCASRHPR